jgi:hypothetical protein
MAVTRETPERPVSRFKVAQKVAQTAAATAAPFLDPFSTVSDSSFSAKENPGAVKAARRVNRGFNRRHDGYAPRSNRASHTRMR